MYTTLTQALDAAAKAKKGMYIVGSSESEIYISYQQLQQESLAILVSLQEYGIKPGDELVFQFDDLKSLLVTHWACLFGAIIPVPLEYGDQPNTMEKVFSVWRALKNPWLATDSTKLQNKLSEFAETLDLVEQWQQMQTRLLFPVENVNADQQPSLPDIQADAIAFVQFSSGSTGNPKGVALTHRNLLSNIGDILSSVEHTEQDCFASWKPITHDFGMIGFHLAPIVGLSDQVRIETSAFIWNPTLWFSAVHKYRANILGSPNFGYRHFLKMFRRGRGKKPEWDLSCVKAILNGAEPISEELCREFSSELAAFGLPKTAMTPGYGLAEGSLISSLSPISEDDVRSIDVDRRYLGIGNKLKFVRKGSAHAVNLVFHIRTLIFELLVTIISRYPMTMSDELKLAATQ